MDEQGPPTKDDRARLTERVNRVATEGRISGADRDIRLGNVQSAQSRAELDLMNRDLDVLEASAPPSATAASTLSASIPSASKRTWMLTAVVAGVALLLAGGLAAIGLVAQHGSGSGSTPHALPPAQTGTASATDEADPSFVTGSGTGTTSGTGPTVPGGYSLSTRGIAAFLATYAKKFGTPLVVDLVMYPDYAVVDVPVAGGQGRQAGWLYREQSGWTTFGGVRAVFPGSRTVDTRQLDVPALVRNIARAQATLKVEKPTQTYVILRFVPQADRVPGVDIHVANGFQESGYLATRLGGSIEAAHPYGE